MKSRLHTIRHTWVTFWKQEASGKVTAPWSPLTVSCNQTKAKFFSFWNHFVSNLLVQPLDDIAEYYGENIAFFFAFKAYYTRSLIIPSSLGLVVFGFQLKDRQLDHWLCLPYAVSVMIWACFMLAFWRQKSSSLAYRWGVFDYEVEETERPRFKGKKKYDVATGELRKHYPIWKRFSKYLVTLPLLLFTMLIMLMIMSTVFTTQDNLFRDYRQGSSLNYVPQISYDLNTYLPNSNVVVQNKKYSSPWSISIEVKDVLNPNFWVATLLYPSLYALLVDIMTKIFTAIALVMNNFENHRTQTTFLNRLILKVFTFRFVSVFLSLYYYAFAMQDKDAAYLRMAVTIFILMTVGQWWASFSSICIPALVHRTLLYYTKLNVHNTNRKIYRAREYFDSNFNEASKDAMHASRKLDKRTEYLEHARSSVWEEATLSTYSTFTG